MSQSSSNASCLVESHILSAVSQEVSLFQKNVLVPSLTSGVPRSLGVLCSGE